MGYGTASKSDEPPVNFQHETKLNLGLYHVISHFILFTVGMCYSGQAWMELLCTLMVIPLSQWELLDAREPCGGQQFIPHIAAMADGH